MIFSRKKTAMNCGEISKSHHAHDIYRKNIGACCLQSEMPLPPQDGFAIEMKNYDDVAEPKYLNSLSI